MTLVTPPEIGARNYYGVSIAWAIFSSRAINLSRAGDGSAGSFGTGEPNESTGLPLRSQVISLSTWRPTLALASMAGEDFASSAAGCSSRSSLRLKSLSIVRLNSVAERQVL